jgi:hypothetical protein
VSCGAPVTDFGLVEVLERNRETERWRQSTRVSLRWSRKLYSSRQGLSRHFIGGDDRDPSVMLVHYLNEDWSAIAGFGRGGDYIRFWGGQRHPRGSRTVARAWLTSSRCWPPVRGEDEDVFYFFPSPKSVWSVRLARWAGSVGLRWVAVGLHRPNRLVLLFFFGYSSFLFCCFV